MSTRRLAELPMPAELEAEVRRFWKEARIFQKSLEKPSPAGPFVFYEGPPTANGLPHNGHVLTRVMKDVFPRWRTMRGHRVDRIAGWDTHGLPVEIEVEKELGIHGKEAIEAYGLEPFSRLCLESVFRYTREWEELTEGVGFWVDTDRAYATYQRSYVESVWWALSELYRRGLLYQDFKVVWWWPQGGTALSAAEVGEGYQTVDDPSATVRLRLTSPVPGVPEGQPVYLLAWTTTPWTLPSNVALAVGPDLPYAVVQGEGELLVVAEALREQVAGEVVATLPGRALVGATYEPLYRFLPVEGRAFVVVPGEHVTLDAGTGIVHTAPAYGEEDFQLRKAEGLAIVQAVGADGAFVSGTGFLEGRFCKDADPAILDDLRARGLLFRSEKYRHPYPFCPRASSDPLIQLARPAWFIRTTSRIQEALANNRAVNWLPETIGEGRFGDFLRNNVDWALSRERFWGTPLNIWTCRACQHRVAPPSVAAIEALGGVLDPSVSPELQVHKPWIDRVELRCPACGGAMARAPEVIDCWFDSGSMPFAQHGFPHQGVAAFREAFPADFISEAIDQTRGWFYSLLMIATLLFDEETCARYDLPKAGFPRPYRNCLVLGHVCDPDGKKESKSKGNYTSPDLVLKGSMRVGIVADPRVKPGTMGMKSAQVKSLGLGTGERLTAPDGAAFDVVAHHVPGKDRVALHPDDAARYGGFVDLAPPFPAPGADAFRWLFFASSPPWVNTRLSLKAILEGQREFLFRLKNVHQFYVLNASDHVPRPPRSTHVLDRWIQHELQALVEGATAHLEAYRCYEPARAITAFVDALANWWLRRSRERFDGPEGNDARDVLFHVLTTLTKVIAPFVPFMAEALYQSLRGAAPDADRWPESVHLCDWPTVDTARLDPGLAARMAVTRELASLGLAARTQVGVRVRQPLGVAEIVLAPSLGLSEADLAELLPLVRDELNVRRLHLSADASAFVTFRVKPDFKALGARLGKDMKACAAAVATLDPQRVVAELEAGGVDVVLPDKVLRLGREELLVDVTPREGYQAAGSARVVVALNVALDEDLLEEGLMRELVSRIQAWRKGNGLAFEDRVVFDIRGGERTTRALARWGDVLGRATRGAPGPAGESAEVVIDGEAVQLAVARA